MVVWLCTDDPGEALNELLFLRGKNDGKRWDMAKVKTMTDPPHTNKKFCVFRKED